MSDVTSAMMAGSTQSWYGMTARNLGQERKDRLSQASRQGFVDGVASVFSVRGKSHPAPPRVRRALGSLSEDVRALQRDSERLVNGHS